jgi:hypothetical protein
VQMLGMIILEDGMKWNTQGPVSIYQFSCALCSGCSSFILLWIILIFIGVGIHVWNWETSKRIYIFQWKRD